MRDALQVMSEQGSGSVLVCDGDELLGILTERDVLKLISEQADFDAPIEQFMTAQPVTLGKDAAIAKAIQLMAEGGYRRIPIVDDRGRPVAMLKVSDVLHHLVEHFPQFIYNLPPAPHHVTQEREGA